jgi:hypothetical protein
MCASVCPSQALFFGTRREVEMLRPNSRFISSFQFGEQLITTKVNMLLPHDSNINHLDVAAAIHEGAIGNDIISNLWIS